MNVHDNILGTIGNTPMVRLNAIAEEFPCPIWAKVEYFNPGHSVKDRMALSMIEAAEASGKLKPGGTVIECTSGNTGMGLALACIVKGYKLICTTNCKQSKEKVDILRAMGAEVHVCPTAVAPDHPDSYYSVAEKLHNDIPNSVWCNQYDNLANREAHADLIARLRVDDVKRYQASEAEWEARKLRWRRLRHDHALLTLKS
ncbi:MAG: pyridoxal-phosphate dependent enzyme, partial [Bacteroidota bacterium]|nr:pyridoxal-phosphate dependent enzyme [Bacteroidota bacterium]